MEANQSRKKVTDGVKLSVSRSDLVWVSLSINVTHCHVRVTIEQVKRCLERSIITINKRSAVYLLWYTHTHTHGQTLSIFIQLKSMSAPKFPFEICLVRLHAFKFAWASLRYVRMLFFSPYVYVWLCGCTAIIITLVNTHMSTYWSCYQWAMRSLRLRRALWICLDFYWDHTARSAWVQLKITSRARLSALRSLYWQH